MQNIKTAVDLRRAIEMLELKKAEQEVFLKERFKTTLQELNPLNSIQNTIKNFINSPDITTKVLNTAIGITTGIISKRMIFGGSKNPIVKILGSLMEIGVAGMVAKNPDRIKSAGMKLFQSLFNFRRSKDSGKDSVSEE
ncbi:MAG: hypothetical protein NTW54_01125 [Bacteroidetes bacterium]|nr:hypothetical protein [Bacteroidota bacterium]